jgi:hypothetical protein
MAEASGTPTGAPTGAAPPAGFAGGDVALLTSADYHMAAQALGCSLAAIRAVAEVEAAGGGFFQDGRPKILFEAHLFSRFTKRRYDATHPAISSPTWNRALYRRGPAEYDRLNQAVALDRRMALQAASWGKFQILGMHFARCGHPTVDAFVAAMCASERRQLEAFVRFIRADAKMHAALVERRWDVFAYRYNGAGYKANKYDTKMAAAYAKFAAAIPTS